MAPKGKSRQLYLIPVLSKALDILEMLQQSQGMTLESIHKQTGISKTTVYRILKSFVHRGYVSQSADGTYRHVTRQKKLRFGFGSQSSEMPFAIAVEKSLRKAAAAVGVDLLVLDNSYDGATAVANAEKFVQSQVDVVIECQIDQHVAPIIADRIAAANIPMIAVDIPHPHAIYFGVDNYRVGYAVGEVLAEHALERWKGKIDWIIGLDLAEAGPMVQSRITGVFEALRNRLPETPVECFVRIDTRGLRDKSSTAVLEFLKRHPKDRRILIAAANDTAALGAIDAVRKLGREKQVAVAGHDCVEEMIAELRRNDSPAVASVSHEVSQYGEYLMRLGLSLLRGEIVPPYNFTQYEVVSRENLPAAGS